VFAADTTLAIASAYDDHEHFALADAAIRTHKPVLAGHAAFEALSVLTRMHDRRVSPATAAAVLNGTFGDPCWMTAEGSLRVFRLIAEANLAGRSIYDALVAQAALDNRRTLLSLDRRARRVYDTVGVDYEMLT
jgi:toxin FitB